MSISGVNSGVSSLNNPYAISWQKELQQRLADFKSLQDALKNGDLAGAKKAFDSLQKSAQLNGQDPTGQLFGPNDQLNADFKAVGDALASGNLTDAKTAFAKLQQDMQAARDAAEAKKSHHHHQSQTATTVTISETVTISMTEQVVPGNTSNDNKNNSADADPGTSGDTGVLNILA